MKKRALLISGVGAAVLLVAGIVYSLNAQASDVSKPVTTPDSNTVRYHVLGTSMDPTIKDGDWLLARTDFKAVSRGQVIIMHYPKDESKIYCRRVIAVAGDRVVMKYFANVKYTTVFTPEHPEGLVFPEGAKPNGNAYGEYDATVEPGNVYVLGDNAVPGGSFDSDEWGQLPLGKVAGVVTKRLEPDPRAF